MSYGKLVAGGLLSLAAAIFLAVPVPPPVSVLVASTAAFSGAVLFCSGLVDLMRQEEVR